MMYNCDVLIIYNLTAFPGIADNDPGKCNQVHEGEVKEGGK